MHAQKEVQASRGRQAMTLSDEMMRRFFALVAERTPTISKRDEVVMLEFADGIEALDAFEMLWGAFDEATKDSAQVPSPPPLHSGSMDGSQVGRTDDGVGFRFELASAINRRSRENGSNTPDFILAGFIFEALQVFDNAVNAREQWYGRVAPTPPAPVEGEGGTKEPPDQTKCFECDAPLMVLCLKCNPLASSTLQSAMDGVIEAAKPPKNMTTPHTVEPHGRYGGPLCGIKFLYEDGTEWLVDGAWYRRLFDALALLPQGEETDSRAIQSQKGEKNDQPA
jgi:hypothetical protein